MKPHQAQKPGEFELVGEKEQGYDPAAVDRYFEELATNYSQLRSGETAGVIKSTDIRTVTFPSQKGGYQVVAVDRTLDRVEDRFAELENKIRRDAMGEEAWRSELEKNAEAIMGRLNRPDGERFRRPSQKLVKGYYCQDVDALCNRLKTHLQDDPMIDPQIIRRARFRSATGDMCYEETQVDAFLDHCIDLILVLK